MEDVPFVKRPAGLLITGLVLGSAVDVLFYDQGIGVNALLFTLMFLGAMGLLARREGVRPVWRNAVLLTPPLLFFAAMTAIRANGLLTGLNFLACLMLSALLSHFLIAGRVERSGIRTLWGAPWKVTGHAMYRAAPLVADAASAARVRERSGRNFVPILRGLLLALPVLMVFVWLLSSADALFARLLGDAGDWLFTESAAERFERLLIVLGAAWLLSGVLVYALTRSEAADAGGDAALAAPAVNRPLGFVEAATVLASVGALFLLFIGVQFAYLFGGADRVQAVPGLTYAEYARRGFAELVTVAVLTLALILGLKRFAAREEAGQARAFNALSTALVALTQVLLVSAYLRMQAYEAAYGATWLRLYVDGFIVWLGVALCWFVVTLWRTAWSDRFGVGAFACCFGFLATMNAVNPDAAIARRNIDRYKKTGIIDVWYLASLSEDATPYLLDLTRRLPDADTRAMLEDRLARQQERLGLEMGAAAYWPSFHLSRWRAANLLAGKGNIAPAALAQTGSAAPSE